MKETGRSLCLIVDLLKIRPHWTTFETGVLVHGRHSLNHSKKERKKEKGTKKADGYALTDPGL